MSQIVLYFLHSTSVLSFCIYVVLTLSIKMKATRSLRSEFFVQIKCFVHIVQKFIDEAKQFSVILVRAGPICVYTCMY